MTLVGDILLGHGWYANGIVHGKWYATALPVAVVSVFCAGTLFKTRRRRALDIVTARAIVLATFKAYSTGTKFAGMC